MPSFSLSLPGCLRTALLAAAASLLGCRSAEPRAPSGPEVVLAADASQADEVGRVVHSLRERYAVVLDSDGCADTLRRAYPDASAKASAEMRASPWSLDELLALERALGRFDPLLRRAGGVRGLTGRDVLVAGKVRRSVRHYVGESLVAVGGDRQLVLFSSGLQLTQPDFSRTEDWLEGIWIHELAHAFVQPSFLRRWVAALDYWKGTERRSELPGAEASITAYGCSAADEDLCESLMFYFIEPEALREGRGGRPGEPGNPCPHRHALLDDLVRSWSAPGE